MATHGCVRLYEDEIQRLYERTRTGTRLQLVYQPYKWGAQARISTSKSTPTSTRATPARWPRRCAVPQALGILSTSISIAPRAPSRRGAACRCGWGGSPSRPRPGYFETDFLNIASALRAASSALCAAARACASAAWAARSARSAVVDPPLEFVELRLVGRGSLLERGESPLELLDASARGAAYPSRASARPSSVRSNA